MRKKTLIKEKKKLNKKAAFRMAAISFVLFILSQVAKRVAANHPAFVEKYFSRGLYTVTSRIQSAIANLLPFSCYEILIVCLVLFGLYRVYRLVQSAFRKTFMQESIRFGTQIITLVCAGLFLFQFTWSLNNYRIPLKDQLGLSVKKTSVSALADTYKALVQSANKARSKLPAVQNSDPDKIRTILDTAWKGYPPLAQKYSVFHSQRVRVKGLYLFSWIQTAAGYSGVYNFFTGEANINIDPPLLTLPHTACHEIAHQMGITLEDEANYAGFLACMSHPDDLFRYSAYLSALTYTGNALYSQSKELYAELSALISDEIRADQQIIREFWEKNQRKGAAEIADKLNEAYLKSNNQPEGMQSYGKFVDLLIADYLQDNEI